MRALLPLIAAAALLAPAAGASAQSPTVWLCRPGIADNPCEVSRTAKVVEADGSSHVEHAPRDRHRPVDCFYVYPTVSRQPGPNATLDIDPEERAVAVAQASRFSQVCRVFAPVYPQITLAGIFSAGGIKPEWAANAYVGMASAFHDYLTTYNHGRGIVLLGHSQGASLLVGLLRNEIDNDPALRRRLVSALILGGSVDVPVGAQVGGSFQHVPACRSPRQTGCVVSYASFDDQPPADSLFGRVGAGLSPFPSSYTGAPQHVLCVNPAAPGGGAGALTPYFRTTTSPAWVTYPGEYRASCASGAGATWLQVDAAHAGKRPVVGPVLGPRWGLHVYDVPLALGNLVALVRSEGAAYRGS
jgi:Protein of unknown function (DUF3089)